MTRSATVVVSKPITTREVTRAFRMTVTPGREETFGIILDETYGDSGRTLATPVTKASPAQTSRILDAVMAAVRGSGHAPSALAFSRTEPVQIDEHLGVRLALTLLASQPVSKHSRVRALVAGINAMSTEETYYWYSKCIGVDANRARKALRTLLSDN